jgi:hypothetical protein
MPIELSDQDILLRLTNTEDSTVERKVSSDYRDCLKTAVAFCNSLPVDDPGIIFVGVYDDGRVQDNNDLDTLQKNVNKEINKAYPPVYQQQKVMKDRNGKEFLVIIVRGSSERPHFAGQAYIRSGSESVVASATQFARLVAERNSKTTEILKWLGKTITFRIPPDTAGILVGSTLHRSGGQSPARVISCNQFFVTVEFGDQANAVQRSYPLPFVEINYDANASRLELIAMEH